MSVGRDLQCWLDKDPKPPRGTPYRYPRSDSGSAIAGQRHGAALDDGSNCTGAGQLVALLAPDPAASGEEPHAP
jgi:hypothetical protein